MPQLLADVVCSAFEPGDAEFEDLGDVSAATASEARTGHVHDAVIACTGDSWEADLLELKRTCPHMVVLGIHRDGRRTWIYQLLPRPCSLGELGPHELRTRLLDEIRIAAT